MCVSHVNIKSDNGNTIEIQSGYSTIATIDFFSNALILDYLAYIKYQGVFVKHYGMPPAATKSKKLFLA